jgi:hypothetical protein
LTSTSSTTKASDPGGTTTGTGIDGRSGCPGALEDLTPAELERFRTERLAKIKPATINREFALLRRVFNVAIRDTGNLAVGSATSATTRRKV